MGNRCHVRKTESTGTTFNGVRGTKNSIHYLRIELPTIKPDQQCFQTGKVLRGFFEEDAVELTHVHV